MSSASESNTLHTFKLRQQSEVVILAYITAVCALGMAFVLAAGLDERILSLYLPILVCMENPYKKNKWR